MTQAVARSSIGGLTYLAPDGPLADEASRVAFTETIDGCIASNRIHLALDLTSMALLDGKALEIVLAVNARLTLRGGRLQFVNPSPLVKDILVANGIIDAAPGAGDEPHAVYSVGRRSAPMQVRRLGEIALELGVITEEQLAAALRMQSATRSHLGQILVEKKMLSEADLCRVLSRQMGIPYITLRPGLYEHAATSLVPREIARRLQVLPMFRIGDTLTLATADPQAVPALDEIQDLTGCKLRLVLALREEIVKFHIDAYQGNDLPPEFA